MRKFHYALILILISGVLLSFVLPQVSVPEANLETRFAPEICPVSSPSAQILISGKGAVGQILQGKKVKSFSTSQSLTTLVPRSSSWVETSLTSAVPLLIDQSNGMAMGACPEIAEASWFVGGSSDLASQDQLLVSNNGSSVATLLVRMWSEKGSSRDVSLTIPAQTGKAIRLDSLTPGARSLVTYVEPQVGRVSVALLSSRKVGIRSAGADFVGPASPPSSSQFIPVVFGVKNQLGTVSATAVAKKATSKKGATPVKAKVDERILRVLVPGDRAATFTAELKASDGKFTPVGLDQVSLKPGVVRDFVFTSSTPTDISAIHIDSDRPILASVEMVRGDYAWSPSVLPLTAPVSFMMPPGSTLCLIGSVGGNASLSVSGVPPVQLLVSPDKVTLWMNKSKSWQRVTLNSASKVIAAIAIADASGIAVLPIGNRAQVGNGSKPINDLAITR